MTKMCIKVIPNAKKDEINKEGNVIIVRTTESPFNGKANKAVIKMLSRYFKGKVFLISGARSTEKVIEIIGAKQNLEI